MMETDRKIEVMTLLKGLPPAELGWPRGVDDEGTVGEAVTVTIDGLDGETDSVTITMDWAVDAIAAVEVDDED